MGGLRSKWPLRGFLEHLAESEHELARREELPDLRPAGRPAATEKASVTSVLRRRLLLLHRPGAFRLTSGHSRNEPESPARRRRGAKRYASLVGDSKRSERR